MKELIKYVTISTVDTCWLNVYFSFYGIDCYNDPPCPTCYSCEPTGIINVIPIFNCAACSCFTSNAQQEERGYVFIPTEQENRYRQIPMTALQFNDFLFGNFQVVEQGKRIRCDDSFALYQNIWCDPSWYCPSGACARNPDCFVTELIVLEPLCECYYTGGPECPVLSQWGLGCLLVMLIVTTIFIMVKRQKALTR